jgi:hypothetical protein
MFQDGPFARLQWGHAPKGVEEARDRRFCDGRDIASMGPRPERRGRGSMLFVSACPRVKVPSARGYQNGTRSDSRCMMGRCCNLGSKLVMRPASGHTRTRHDVGSRGAASIDPCRGDVVAASVGRQAGRYASKRRRQSINEETRGRDSAGLLITLLEHRMPTPAPRKRKPATVQSERTVKTSLVMGASLHLQLSVAASIAGIDRNALAVEILTEALRGIVVVDRRKNSGRSGVSDRPVLEGVISPDDEKAA